MQCELYTCYKTIEYKNKEINNDDIVNIMLKLHKLRELYENSKIVKEENEDTKGNNSSSDSNHNESISEIDLEYHTENYQSISKEKESNECAELNEDIFQGYSSNKPTERIKVSNLVINVSKPPTQNTINELETVLKQRPKPKQTIVYSNGYKEPEENVVKKKTKEERTIPDIPQLPKVFPNFLNNKNNNKINEAVDDDDDDLTSHT